MSKGGYASPQALGQAVQSSARKSGRDIGRAIDGFYKDRLLCRVFSEPEPRFVLKGGQSQLARRLDARESRDIDLVGMTAEINVAIEDLTRLAARDLDDYLEFRFVSARPIPVSQEYRTGVHVEFQPFLGKTKRLNPIGVDLVVDQTPPESYVRVRPKNRLDIRGLPTFDYALQTMEERIADKVCATMQLFNGRPSSRVKDLVDLVVAMLTEDVDADTLSVKTRRETVLRRMSQIGRFSVPGDWKDGKSATYLQQARECGLPDELTDVRAAEKAVASWLDPVLDGKARGLRWSYEERGWV